MNSTMLIVIAFVAHIGLPIIMMYWLVKTPKCLFLTVGKIFLCISYIAILFFLGAGWQAFGVWIKYLLLSGVILASLSSFKKSFRLHFWPLSLKSWSALVFLNLLALVNLFSVYDSFSMKNIAGHRTANLASPLRNGNYYVVQGGNAESVNHHFPVSAQKFALDIVKISKFGVRANGIMPSKLSDYLIYGEKVYSPCSGDVVMLEKKVPNTPIGETNTTEPAGNFVAIRCIRENVTVFLAHLAPKSVAVEIGETVNTDSVVGEVGNSGNTTEPHLHIHTVADSKKRDEIFYSGTPVAMLFNKQFLVRGDGLRR